MSWLQNHRLIRCLSCASADTKTNRTENKLSAIVWTLRNCSLDLIQFCNSIRARATKDSFEVMCRKCQDKFACLKLTLIACVHWTEIRKTREGNRVKKKRRLNPINVNDLMIRISIERMMITALHFQSINIQLHEWRTNNGEDLWHDNRFCICCPAFPSPSPRPSADQFEKNCVWSVVVPLLCTRSRDTSKGTQWKQEIHLVLYVWVITLFYL